MKRIGLVTWFGGSNYGTSLQAFALNFTLQQMGAFPILLKRYKTWRNVLGSLYRGIKAKFQDLTLFGLSDEKKQKINQFKKENFCQFHQCVGIIGSFLYKKQISSLYCIISGSDQLWNPYHTDSFLLLKDFDSKKYSYASSLGVTKIPLEKKSLYKEALASFTAISVREDSAVQPLEEVYSGEIKKVLDPTFLLTKQQWMNFAQKSRLDFDVSCPYLLAYFIADNVVYWDRIVEIQEEKKINRVVILPMLPNHFRDDLEIVSNAGIYDFVYLIAHAALVCTDSFHATAMSINLEVDFVTFLRFKNEDILSQNARLINLLDRYGLSDRLYENNRKGYLSPINFSGVREILSYERTDSFSYLHFIVQDC